MVWGATSNVDIKLYSLHPIIFLQYIIIVNIKYFKKDF